MADKAGWLTTREVVETFGFDPRPYESVEGETKIRSTSRDRKYALTPGDMGKEKIWHLQDVLRVKALVAPNAKPVQEKKDPEPDFSIG